VEEKEGGESEPGRALGVSLIPSYLPTPPWRAVAGGSEAGRGVLDRSTGAGGEDESWAGWAFAYATDSALPLPVFSLFKRNRDEQEIVGPPNTLESRWN
jgi:hypothetical protein